MGPVDVEKMLTVDVIKEIKLRINDILGDEILKEFPGIMQDMVVTNDLISHKQASRLLFVLYLLCYLNGSYNRKGIHLWLKRRRSKLSGLSPAHFMIGDWDPADPARLKVLELARSLAQ